LNFLFFRKIYFYFSD